MVFQENYKVFEIFWWHCPFKYFNLIAAFSWDYVQKMNPRLLYTVYVKPIVCLMYRPQYVHAYCTVHKQTIYCTQSIILFCVQYLFELFDGPVDFQSVCRNAGKTLSRSYKNKTTFLQQQHNIYSQQLMKSKNCVYKKLIINLRFLPIFCRDTVSLRTFNVWIWPRSKQDVQYTCRLSKNKK